jgi:hypothetical protein
MEGEKPKVLTPFGKKKIALNTTIDIILKEEINLE